MVDALTDAFIKEAALPSGQETRNRKQATDYTLTGEVRQEETRGSIPSQVWYTSIFLRDAHKPTGEASVSRVLLGGRRTLTDTDEYEHDTTGGRIDD